MGFETRAVVAGSYEQVLTSALRSTKHVFLFDQPTLVKEVGAYRSVYFKLCSNSNREFYELEARDITEQGLVDELVHSAPENEMSTQHFSAHSDYRILTDFIDWQQTGLICIHDGHQLSTKGIHILSRLRNHVRRKGLRWQILIFADTSKLDDLALVQLSVDLTYPQSIADATSRDSRAAKQSPAAESRLNYIFRILLGVSIFTVIVFTIWKLASST